jgi:hypothetical protein
VNKVDCELFDEEVNNLKSAINALSSASPDSARPMAPIIQQTGMNSKDLNKLRETSAKVEDLEALLNKLLKDMKTLNI